MSSVVWQRVEAAFTRVREATPEDRTRVLDEVCAGDALLRTEVESLLAHADDETFLETPAVGDLGRVLQTWIGTEGALLGADLCGYRLESVVGSGGMGTVYRARAADGRAVAVKVLKASVATSTARQRFAAECEVLALLQHPNIARLLDSGVTQSGLPFAVMPLIDGLPINAACDRARLDVVQRVRLFLVVCAAVQHAHQNMVVHRDLKPGNVLVDTALVPHVVDFGIAKVLPAVPDAEPALSTRVLTPEYGSPEQIRGEATTIASDVYALGVLLYELLTGQRPYELRSGDPREWARVIAEVEPLPASQVVLRGDPATCAVSAAARSSVPQRLARQLAGDLDTVLACALRKEPERRYATVERFADDLARCLDGRPVAARGDSLLYRARKVLERHGLLVACAAVVALALLLGGGGVLWQHSIAREEAATAQRITDLLLDTFAVAAPGETGFSEATALVDRAAAHVDHYPLRGATRATLLHSLGVIYRNLGDRGKAELRLRAALALREAELGEGDAATVDTMSQLGALLVDRDQFEEASTLLQRALVVARRLSPSEELVRCLDALGCMHSEKREHDRAQAAFHEALEVGRGVLGAEHSQVAVTMNNLGVDYWRQGQLDRADELQRAALAIRRRNPQGHRMRIALLIHNLGVLAGERGQHDEARTMLEEGLRLREQMFTPRHRHVAHSLYALGKLHLRRRAPEEAEPVLRRCLAIQREAIPSDWRTYDTMTVLAECLLDQDKVAEAETLLREGVPVVCTQLGPDHEHSVEARQRWERWLGMSSGQGRR